MNEHTIHAVRNARPTSASSRRPKPSAIVIWRGFLLVLLLSDDNDDEEGAPTCFRFCFSTH